MDSFSDLSEDGLGDDATLEPKLDGKLHFFDDLDASKSPTEDNSFSAIDSMHFHGLLEKPGPSNVKFDVIDARIEASHSKKYVVYTILVSRSAGMDSIPVKVEKRYTEFYLLNADLHKLFPQLMKEISFPSKCLRRNFEAETIACRSRSFEQYLSHLFSIELIRTSSQFKDFLYGHNLRDGYHLIQNGQYSEAAISFVAAWKLQKKLFGDLHSQAISTLCGIICCYEMLQQYQVAHNYAELALESIADDDGNVHLVPLLKLDIRLCWILGMDKKQLESRLKILQRRGLDIDGMPSLLEQVIKKLKF